MSKIGRFVFECQEIADNAVSETEVAEQCEKQFADRARGVCYTHGKRTLWSVAI